MRFLARAFRKIEFLVERSGRINDLASKRTGVRRGKMTANSCDQHHSWLATVVVQPRMVAGAAAQIVDHLPIRAGFIIDGGGPILEITVRISHQNVIARLLADRCNRLRGGLAVRMVFNDAR